MGEKITRASGDNEEEVAKMCRRYGVKMADKSSHKSYVRFGV